jgi:uncharacterized SAM-binding protein YcdF (DUF218 family)
MPLLLTLQKTFSLLATPTGILWIALIWCTLRAGVKKWWGGAWMLGLTTVFYTLAGNVHVGHAMMRSLERQLAPPVTQTEPLDATCVFGGGSERDLYGRAQLASSGDRIMAAARLYHSGQTRMLVASGVSADAMDGMRNLGEETRQVWLGLGIPEEAIRVVPEACRVTADEVKAFRRMQQEAGWKRVGFLSSAWHLPRILRLCSRAGFAPIPVGSDWRGRERQFQLPDCVPQGSGFWRVNLAVWEVAASWLGR